MTDDMQLLREYSSSGSESAFSELVSRHVNFVYSSALRQVRDPQLAEEVSQAVFIILARKATSLQPGVVLGGWLHQTTRNVAANVLRSEFRRRQRETEAHAESAAQSGHSESVWREMLPLLDDALERLKPAERDALVLRYFQNRSLQEVATALGLQERAAQKRVARSLDKLRGIFLKRGVDVSATALAGAVSANSVLVAPGGLAASIMGAVKGSSAAASAATLANATLKAIAWAKVKTGLTVAVGIAALVSVPIAVVQAKSGRPAVISVPAFQTLDADGGSNHDFAWMVSGRAGRYQGRSLGYAGHAEWFVPEVAGKLGTIEVAMRSKSPGHGHLNLFIARDNQGAPGAIVESFRNVIVPDMDQKDYSPVVFKSALQPGLQAGTKYWFVAEPADDSTTIYWFYSNQTNSRDIAKEISAGTWTNVSAAWLEQNLMKTANATSSHRNAAFAVNVTSRSTP
jgi:RNA polymerase sigma factor (sigma-70 family)